MTNIKRQRAFFKDLKEIYALLKEAPQQNKKIKRATRVIGKGLVVTKEQLKEQIELAKKEAAAEPQPILQSIEQEYEGEGLSITGAINFEEKEISVEVEEEDGISYTAQLSERGIVLGQSKTLAKIELDLFKLKMGLINVECTAAASAKLAIGQQLLTDKIGVDATLDLHAEVALEAYISILKLLELGGSVTVNADASLSASIEIEQEKGLVKVDPLTIKSNAEFNLFLRPSEEIMEIAETICEFLKVDGKDEHEFDKKEYAWVIPLGDIDLLELEIPGFEFEFDAGAKIEPSFDFLKILEKKKKNLGGFPGTIVALIDTVNDVVEFLDDVCTDIGNFFDDLGDGLMESAEKLLLELHPELAEELRQERLQEAINELKTVQMSIIFGAAIDKMKKQPHHLRELYKLKKEADKKWYVFMQVWPEVMRDKFVIESFLAVGQDDVVLLEKNSRIAEAEFTIERYDITGPQVDGMHVMGEYITLSLDVRKDELWVQDITNQLFKGSAFDIKINAQLEAVLMCGEEEVDKKVIRISELIEDDVPMNNAYTLKLLSPAVGAYCNTPRQLENCNTPRQLENWKIKVRLDFVGDIMDITAEYPIKMTYKQVQDQSMPELQQSILYPEIKGISIKGEKEGKYFVQGTPLDVKTKIGIEMLPPEVDFLKGTVIVAVTCNKKLVHSKAKAQFKLVDHENPMNLVNVPVHLPFGFDETAMGGDWLVHIHVKMEGMETIKKARRIAVANPNRDYSIGDGGKSWVSED